MFSCSIPFLGIPILSDDNPVEKVSLNFQQPEQKRHYSIAKVNSGRSIPKAEVTSANPKVEVTPANFTPLAYFML